MSKRAMKNAIKKAGGLTALAEKIGASPQKVRYWAYHSKRGPAPEFVLRIESVTGISRHDLRRDVFPLDVAA